MRVGDDVGIVPYNRDGLRPIQRTRAVGFRDDVGIVPYKLDGVRSIQFNILFL